MVRSATGRKSKAKGGNAKAARAVGNGTYKIYTRPELYEDDRPLMTWAVRVLIVMSMLGIGAVFRQPLHELLASALKRFIG